LPHVVGLHSEAYPIANAGFNFIIVITLLFSNFFIPKKYKLNNIYGCAIVTSIFTALLLFTSNTFLQLVIILSSGISFSVGQLTCFAYFWRLTTSEERGRWAGLLGFIALPFYYIVDFLIAENLDFFGTVLLCIILSLGPLAVKFLKPEKTLSMARSKERGNYPEKRTVFLYLIPWIIFSLINATLSRNISFYISQQVPFTFYLLLTILQLIAVLFGALSGGIIADFLGRRLSLAIGLTLYGISSALVGLVDNYIALYFVYIANGLNWGILLTLYLLVVWGDLANKENHIRMYSIGLMTFYLITGIGSLFTPQIFQIPLIISSLVSCLLIFLSNIPLILAPELLPTDFRKKIKLKLFMKTLKKTRE
jgi:hypothetical protein